MVTQYLQSNATRTLTIQYIYGKNYTSKYIEGEYEYMQAHTHYVYNTRHYKRNNHANCIWLK